MLRSSKFDRQIRKLAPSLSRLTYNPLVKIALNSLDILPRAMFPELRSIPPNHMRVRVGVSNRLFANGIHYLAGARDFWFYCLNNNIISLNSKIVDIGCGCGRYAHILRDSNFLSQAFSGSYIGIDIDEELLEWCRKNFDAPRFEFVHSTHNSKSYVNQRQKEGRVSIPGAQDVDLVFSTSLFSHLLEEELLNYVEESFRVLRPGGTMMMSVFCLDYPPPTYGNRHTFSHRIGNAHVESLAQPEAAVAYTEDYLLSLARKVGFNDTRICTAPGLWQPRLICVK